MAQIWGNRKLVTYISLFAFFLSSFSWSILKVKIYMMGVFRENTMSKKCPNLEFFWSVFSRIQTELLTAKSLHDISDTTVKYPLWKKLSGRTHYTHPQPLKWKHHSYPSCSVSTVDEPNQTHLELKREFGKNFMMNNFMIKLLKYLPNLPITFCKLVIL